MRTVEGVQTELSITPARRIEEMLRAGSSRCAVFAKGRILHDSEGVVAELVTEAQSVYERGPAVADEHDVQRLRIMCTELLHDALDLGETDAAAANYVVSLTLQAAMEACYRINRRWPVKPKHVLRDLHEHAPDVEAMVRAVLARESPLDERRAPLDARCARLARFVEHALAPVGGTITEWETERQHLPEDAGEA